MIKNLIKNNILKLILRKNYIYSTGYCSLSKELLKSKGSKKFPILINNSNSENLFCQEGCRIFKANLMGKVKLGRFVSINGPSTTISSIFNPIEIGSFTSIAEGVQVYDWGHKVNRISSYFFSRNIFDQNIQDDIESKGKVKIEEDVWIGTNSVILNGVKIGRGSVIAANSTVTKDIPRYSICIGNNIVRKRFPKNVIEKLEEMKWWDWEVEKILKNKDLFIGPINNVMQ